MIKVYKIVNRSYDSNCYIVTKQKQFIIIDPCVEKDLLKDFFEKKECVGIFLTHGHYDHFCSIETYALEKTCYYMHKEAVSKILDLNKSYGKFFNINNNVNIDLKKVKFLKEEKIKIANFEIDVLEVPGHTNCCLCFMIEDNLFTGDTLFKESIGRTDLYSANFKDMQKSLQKLVMLPKHLVVYPGHYEKTSISDELNNNVFLKRVSRRLN
ncbi:MAG: MBL fold metallo-hydrolase [Bacilli bacterium]|jgi:hydroxyacylglutathione hydrolase